MTTSEAQSMAAETARRVLAGLESPIVAARLLYGLLRQAGVSEGDNDLLAMAGIDSETDALPVGAVRRYWAETALNDLESEVVASERWAMKFGESAFRSILARFGQVA
jgi:hypothetical protein